MGLRKTTACFLRDAGGELIHNTSAPHSSLALTNFSS